MTEIKMDHTSVKGYPLFAHFLDEELQLLLSILECRFFQFHKEECINTQTSRLCPNTFSYILSGGALLKKYDDRGNQAILDFARPGYLLGYYSILTDMTFDGLHIVATSPGRMLCFRTEPLLTVEKLVQQPLLTKLEMNMMNLLAQHSWQLMKKSEILSCHSLREKILSFLSAQREYFQSDTFEIPMDRQTLADYLYVNRSALSRELGKLKEEGLIDYHRSKFLLLFPRALQ